MLQRLLTVLLFVFCGLTGHGVMAQERTLKQFEKYLAGKLTQLAQEDRAAISEAVDANSDGMISEAEFGKRMQVIQSLRSRSARQRPGAPGAPDTPGTDERKGMAKHEVAKFQPLVNAADAAVLLITSDDLANAWAPFARWKTALGKLTKVVTVGQIAAKYKADNIQEKIRLCVREHIDNHKTRWVILGGDCLPGGKGVVPGGHITVHRQEPAGIPTDIVYLSPTNWDADGDGIYGEFQDDRDAITYPDGSVGIGRIPVRSVEDIAAFTEKVIAYESRYPTDQFTRRMIYTCTDQPAYPKVRNSWDGYLSKVWDGDVGRYFSQETPWDEEGKPGSFPLSAENMVDLINRKDAGKLHIHGHGHLPAWVLERSVFTGQHVGQLKNDGAYPIITTVSCNTGEFDSAKDPSIVEQILRTPNAGSVAVVAPIRTGKPHFAKRSDFRLMVTQGKLDGTTMTMTRFWTQGLGKGKTTGHAIASAKHEMAADATKSPSFHLCVCELNLLGDPTLDMRAEAPRNPEWEVKSSVAGKQVQLNVETNAPGCTVCVWDGADGYRVVNADESGSATVEVQAEVGSELTVTISGANLNAASNVVSLAE